MIDVLKLYSSRLHLSCIFTARKQRGRQEKTSPSMNQSCWCTINEPTPLFCKHFCFVLFSTSSLFLFQAMTKQSEGRRSTNIIDPATYSQNLIPRHLVSQPCLFVGSRQAHPFSSQRTAGGDQ